MPHGTALTYQQAAVVRIRCIGKGGAQVLTSPSLVRKSQNTDRVEAIVVFRAP
jgi:hypothetical protein